MIHSDDHGMILTVVVLSIFVHFSSSSSTTISSSKQLPQAIIIGVKKCGTRALLKFLSIHPSIAVSSREIHFFDSNEHFQQGLSWYQNQMPDLVHPQSITIEKTPHYFIDRQSPSRLAHLLPQVKLIVILRDPIERAISDYLQLKDRHPIYPSFDQFVSWNNFTRWTPIRIGCYANYLRRWLKYLPLERIHFVDGENLIRRPWEEFASIERFLNISHYIREEHFYFNSNKRGFPCIKQNNGCLGHSKGRAHPTISNITRETLQQLYTTCNKHLKQLAQIDFPWFR